MSDKWRRLDSTRAARPSCRRCRRAPASPLSPADMSCDVFVTLQIELVYVQISLKLLHTVQYCMHKGPLAMHSHQKVGLHVQVKY